MHEQEERAVKAVRPPRRSFSRHPPRGWRTGKGLPEGSARAPDKAEGSFSHTAEVGFQGETSPLLRAEPQAACWLDLPNTRNYKLLCTLHPSLWTQGFMVVVFSGPSWYSGCVLGCMGSEINYPFSSWVSRPHMGTQEPSLDPMERVHLPDILTSEMTILTG